MFTYGLLITIGSLAYTIVLALVYFSKRRLSFIRNKLYFSFLISSMAFQITEILAIVMLKYVNIYEVTRIFWRIHWLTGIFSFGLLYIYCITYIRDIHVYTLKELFAKCKKLKLFTSLIGLFMIVYIFLPYEGLDINDLTFVPGITSLIVGSGCMMIEFLIAYDLLKYHKQTSSKIQFSVWIIIVVTVIINFFQVLFPYISFQPFGFTLGALFLYFMVENPDLETIKELQELKDEVDRAGRAKLDFLFNMSHDIRSPMNAIVGFSKFLTKVNTFDEKQIREDIENIKISGNNLVDIINNILDISKIETGEETLLLREYSLNNLVSDLPNVINARIGERPIKLIMDVDQNISAKLYGDTTKIYQILMNILTNSAKYTEVGRITFKVTSTKDRDIEVLHFKISDTGYGIKKEDYDKLFKKFNRLDEATNKEIEGTGLGLVITKKYVDTMNGKIWFESEYEVGTTFYVDIPQKVIDSRTLKEVNYQEEETKDEEVLDCSNYKILIVDDNRLNVKVAARLLEKYKFNIDCLYSGKDCVYKIKEGIHYDLIFMDHMMPEMDGIRALHIIKKLDGYYIPPVIALTANAMSGMKEMYLNEGFSDYLSKPIKVEELDRVIMKYFGNRN